MGQFPLALVASGIIQNNFKDISGSLKERPGSSHIFTVYFWNTPFKYVKGIAILAARMCRRTGAACFHYNMALNCKVMPQLNKSRGSRLMHQ